MTPLFIFSFVAGTLTTFQERTAFLFFVYDLGIGKIISAVVGI